MSAVSLPLEPIRPVKLSYEDFVLLPDDGMRHELLDGEHVVTPSPSRRHQKTVMNLIRLLDSVVRSGRLGELYAAPFDVVLSRHDVVDPDLLFVSRQRLDRLTDANVQGAPDLVIEVLSPSTAARDEAIKRRIYDKFGVVEYWLVDPEARIVRIVRFGEESGGAERRLGPAEALDTTLLPGLRVVVADVFED